MFTTTFSVKASLSDKEKEVEAMKQWRKEFGTCNLEVQIKETIGDITRVDVTCTVPVHEHSEGLVE